MKLPKLKYYYLALSEDQYDRFRTTRRVEVTPMVIDVITGAVRGRPTLTLCARAGLADDLVREHYRHSGPTWVLRIPREQLDRARLVTDDGEVYHYDRTIELAHCGVDRFDLDPSQPTTARWIQL